MSKSKRIKKLTRPRGGAIERPKKKATGVDWRKRALDAEKTVRGSLKHIRQLTEEIDTDIQQLADLRRELLAGEAEVHFWITEYERWRDRVVEYERLHATLPAEARRQLVLAKFEVEKEP